MTSTRTPAVSQRLLAFGRRVQPVLSGAVLLFLLAALWMELRAKENLPELGQAFLRQLHAANWLWLAAVIGLMPLNWWAETRKWHQFVRQYDPISPGRALLAVWVGVSFSLFTPNRIGEYGGRVLLLRPASRWKAVVVNLVGNYSQYLVLLTMGLAGAAWFVPRFLELDPFWSRLFFPLALLGSAIMLALYFNMRRVLPLLQRLGGGRLGKGLLREAEVLQQFNTRELAGILGWAFLRYSIYTTQYYLTLRFFGITPGLLNAYAGIAAIFLVQTSLPLPPLAGLLGRGNLAVWVWLPFGANAVSSLAATFTLWIINLILPALIGTFSLFYVNIAKENGYEDD